MKVSIIIPYKEDRGYLNAAIESARNQTYENTEIILHQSNKNVGYNINRAYEKSMGDYIKILCDDDLLSPNSIKDLVDNIGYSDFIHGKAINFFENGNESQVHAPHILTPTLKDVITKGYPIHGGTVMYRRESIERLGFFNEELWTGEEFEMHLRWLSSDAKISYCDSIVYYYRRWFKQKSLGIKTREYQNKRKQSIDKIRKYYADNYL